MKTITKAALAAAALVAGSAVLAEEYVDYTPQKGAWRINAIEVDPNHVDEYLTGLRKSQVSAFEVLKKRGLIDDYRFVVRHGYVKGAPNVLIMVHMSSLGLLDPDKARDMAVTKEIDAAFTPEQNKAAVAGYEKYRTFIDEALWTDVVMTK